MSKNALNAKLILMCACTRSTHGRSTCVGYISLCAYTPSLCPPSMSTLDSSDTSRHHFLATVLIVAPLGATLLPIIGILIFFAPSESRKRPVFLLNILACLLGICQAIFFTCLNSSVLLHPDNYVSRTVLVAAIVVLLAPPILVDSIMLFRLLAFYPIQLTPRKTLIAILTPTCLVKAARLACLIAFVVTYPISRLSAPGYVAVQGLIWGRGHWIIAVFALQALDNACVCLSLHASANLDEKNLDQICLINVPL
jgi:hypothetical protein